MLNLIRRDFVLLISTRSFLFLFLVLLPFYQFALGTDTTNPITLLSIITIAYMLTTMSFSYETQNKPYVVIRSLPIKTMDIVIYKYIQIFTNFFIAVVYVFLYTKILNILGIGVIGDFTISTLKQSLILVILSLAISLPLQFRLTAKIASFINIFIYISVMNYFSIVIGESAMFTNLSELLTFVLLAFILLVSLFLSILLYKTRDLS